MLYYHQNTKAVIVIFGPTHLHLFLCYIRVILDYTLW